MDNLISQLPTVLVEGLVLGSVYAMIALGYTMVYGVLELINFAHAEIFMIGAVTGVEVFRVLSPVLPSGFAILLFAIIIGAGVSGVVAMGVERFAYRPLRRRGATNRLVPLIVAIGVSYILQDVVRAIEALWHNEFNLTMLSAADLEQNLVIGGITIKVKSVVLIGVAVLMLLGLMYLVNRTKLGKAIRAVAQDPNTAGLMGINPNRIISLTFLIGGALGGVAGVLFALMYSPITAYVGFLPGIKAFTAAVLGGIGNIPGAVVGGLILGEIETLAYTYLPALTNGAFGSEYKDIIAFIILILILLVRPQGLLGQVVKEKV